MLATAAVDRSPFGYAGAALLEGSLYYSDASLQAIYRPICDSLKQSPLPYEGINYPTIKYIAYLNQAAPSEPSPFVEGLTNRDFFFIFATSPNDPPAGEAPGYTLLAGDMTGFTFSPESSVLQLMFGFNDYEATGVQRDYICGYAGERTFTSRLAQFRKPLLSVQAGHGFGAVAEQSLALFLRADISRVTQPDFGHADWLVHSNVAETTVQPLVQWMQQKILPNWIAR